MASLGEKDPTADLFARNSRNSDSPKWQGPRSLHPLLGIDIYTRHRGCLCTCCMDIFELESDEEGCSSGSMRHAEGVVA